jgi:hypothetical protein
LIKAAFEYSRTAIPYLADCHLFFTDTGERAKEKIRDSTPPKNKTSADTNIFVELNNMLPCEQLKFNLPCISPHAQPTH